MIVFRWVKDGEYWEAAASLTGGPDDVKLPNLTGSAKSRKLNSAFAYALEELAKQIKEIP